MAVLLGNALNIRLWRQHRASGEPDLEPAQPTQPPLPPLPSRKGATCLAPGFVWLPARTKACAYAGGDDILAPLSKFFFSFSCVISKDNKGQKASSIFWFLISFWSIFNLVYGFFLGLLDAFLSLLVATHRHL